jgi:excisionase family DNA binding protein
MISIPREGPRVERLLWPAGEGHSPGAGGDRPGTADGIPSPASSLNAAQLPEPEKTHRLRRASLAFGRERRAALGRAQFVVNTTEVRVMSDSGSFAAPAGGRLTGTWLTPAQATRYLALPSRRALYQAVRRGHLPVHRLGKRRMLFNRAELDRVLFGKGG